MDEGFVLVPQQQDELQVDWVEAGSGAGIAMILFGAVSVLANLVVLLFVLLGRKHYIFKASSVPFCCLMLLGSLCADTAIFFYVGPPSISSCSARHACLHSLSFIFSCLGAKNYIIIF